MFELSFAKSVDDTYGKNKQTISMEFSVPKVNLLGAPDSRAYSIGSGVTQLISCQHHAHLEKWMNNVR